MRKGSSRSRTKAPAAGERSAVVGYSGQYDLAARIVQARLPTLEWIRVADPSAGAADDFQFKAGETRHALQVKWSQYPASYQWSELVNPQGTTPPVLRQLAAAWTRIREDWTGALCIHLCTNNFASTAKPPAGTPLAYSTATPPQHFAAFLTRSFAPVRNRIRTEHVRWAELHDVAEVAQWAEAWTAIYQAADLDEESFAAFIGDFSLTFVPHAEPDLTRRDEDVVSDTARLSSELQSIVADPAQPTQLTRSELLDRLGWKDRVRYRNPHKFPVPESYTANEAARQALEELLRTVTRGYVALVGPAGSGKSTLLEGLDLPGRTARYYAFVPDSPDPLSGRGEAESFFHDLSLALEGTGLYRHGFGRDLRGQRSVFFDQLGKAGQRFAEHGVKTIMVVDGLDHIPREQHPTRSLLDELPPPSALPDGVYMIVGTQTLQILPQPIQEALNAENRTVDLPPLSAEEVRRIATNSGVSSWLLPGQISRLVSTSEGHPLALTYILQELLALENETDMQARQHLADSILINASAYGGDIEQRYRGYLRQVVDSDEVTDVLATVSRLRSPIHLDWLRTWVTPHALSRFVQETETFFHRSGREWRFIHNSFRKFLADETARVAGTIDIARDQELHAALAERCANAGDWAMYADEELTHRFLAGQFQEVIDTATPARLRQSMLALRPSATVREQSGVAVRAAADAEDYTSLLRTLLFLNELAQRDMVLEPKVLAKTMVRIAPDRAFEHVVRGGSLRLDSEDALALASEFARAGAVEPANEVIRAVGGLAGLVDDIKKPGGPGRHWPDAVANWAEVIWYHSGVDRVLTELDHLLPRPPVAPSDDQSLSSTRADPGPDGEQDLTDARDARQAKERSTAIVAARNLVHARCFDLSVEMRDDHLQERLGQLIDAESDTPWRARVRVVRAFAAVSDGRPAEVLRHARELLELDTLAESDVDDETGEDEELPSSTASARSVPLSLRLQAAECLIRAGMREASEIGQLIPPGTRARWPSTLASDSGFSPYGTALALHRIRHLCPDEAQADGATEAPTYRDAGQRRFQEAFFTLATLEGQALAAEIRESEPPAVAARADKIIRLLEVPPRQAHDWTGWYMVRDAAPGLFGRLVRLAMDTGGADELERLLRMFTDAWTTERAVYWPLSIQQSVVMAAIAANPAIQDWAVATLDRIEHEVGVRSYEPHGRVETFMKQAEAWAAVGEIARAQSAAQLAVQAAWGPGQHDDDTQLVGWLDWLTTASDLDVITRDEISAECRSYASRLVAASTEAEHQCAKASARLIEVLFGHDAAMACAIAEDLVERGVLEEADGAQALVRGAAQELAVPAKIPAFIQAHLVMPITTSAANDALEALRARDVTGDITALLHSADALWTVRATEQGDSTSNSHAVDPPNTRDSVVDVIEVPINAGALLAAMRDAPGGGPSDAQLRAWERAAELAFDETAGPIAGALLDEATRLNLAGRLLGRLAAVAAQAGAVRAATEALSAALARIPAYGWLRHYDGGSRISLFGEALRGRHPALIHLAAQDLAGSFSTGAIRGHVSPDDLRRFADLLGGPQLVAHSWPDVRAYLDEYAPTNVPIPTDPPLPARTPAEALLRWTAGRLGHPIRVIDFAARSVLQAALREDTSDAQLVLGQAIDSGGWMCEAALLTLITAPQRPITPLSGELQAAVIRACTNKDAIIRSLAGRLLDQHGIGPPGAPFRSLPDAYRLSLPPVPPRAVSELDREGVPYIDVHDPQQSVAPFDVPLSWLAEMADLEEAAVLYRAAGLTAVEDDPWTKGGHRAHASRLKRRGSLHTYRPWAYMAGRRALGVVLSELLDADVIAIDSRYPAYSLGLVDERLSGIELEPLDSTTPSPWRRDSVAAYDTRDWCNDVQEAAASYRSAYTTSPYIVAELSEWRTHDWGRPEETRELRAHQQQASLIIGPEHNDWEMTYANAMLYPALPSLRWKDEELVVRGLEVASDARWHEWIALHPYAARRLGWIPDPDSLFGWTGLDGQWRARTSRKVRGQLSHQPPLRTYSAEVWQVVLSDPGRTELVQAFPDVRRTLSIVRTLRANERESRLQDEVGQARVALDG